MYTSFGIKQMAELNQAVAYFLSSLRYRINGTGVPNAVLEKWIKDYEIDFYSPDFSEKWQRIDVHCFREMWPSTAGGWGGIGGAAMTEYYSTVIHLSELNIIAVFWNGNFAYIVKDSKTILNAIKKNRTFSLEELDELEVILKHEKKTYK